MNKKYILGVIAFLAVAAVVLISGCISEENNEEKTLLVYSGAGLKEPMDEIAKEFENESGIKVTYVYGGAGVLFAKIETEKTGDVFIPGSELNMNTAKEKGYVDSSKPVALHIPAIIVANGNLRGITKVEDMAKEGVRVSLGKEDACAICALSPKIFKNAGVYERVQGNAVTNSRTTVNELAIDVVLGEADAAIVWISTAESYAKSGKAEMIEIDEKLNVIETVPIAVLKFSKNQEESEKFTEYVIKRKDVWEKYGYTAAE